MNVVFLQLLKYRPDYLELSNNSKTVKVVVKTKEIKTLERQKMDTKKNSDTFHRFCYRLPIIFLYFTSAGVGKGPPGFVQKQRSKLAGQTVVDRKY